MSILRTIPRDRAPDFLRGHRFPREIISQGVWLYYRFSLSLRDVEDLLAKRRITVTPDRANVRCEGSSQRSTGFLSYL